MRCCEKQNNGSDPFVVDKNSVTFGCEETDDELSDCYGEPAVGPVYFFDVHPEQRAKCALDRSPRKHRVHDHTNGASHLRLTLCCLRRGGHRTYVGNRPKDAAWMSLVA